MFGIDPVALPMAAFAGVLLVIIVAFHVYAYFSHKKHKNKGH